MIEFVILEFIKKIVSLSHVGLNVDDLAILFEQVIYFNFCIE